MKLLEIKNLCKSFDNNEILKDVSLDISGGKIIGLLGKNGVGKTTLIKLINDLVDIVAGTEIGTLFKKEREKLNMKLEVAVEEIGISYHALWSVENGKDFKFSTPDIN